MVEFAWSEFLLVMFAAFGSGVLIGAIVTVTVGVLGELN